MNAVDPERLEVFEDTVKREKDVCWPGEIFPTPAELGKLVSSERRIQKLLDQIQFMGDRIVELNAELRRVSQQSSAVPCECEGEGHLEDDACGQRKRVWRSRCLLASSIQVSKPEDIREWLAETNEEALLLDGFEKALIGIASRCSKPDLAVFSYEKILEILMEEGLSYEEAEEHISFNVAGAWAGEFTPLIMRTEFP